MATRRTAAQISADQYALGTLLERVTALEAEVKRLAEVIWRVDLKLINAELDADKQRAGEGGS